MLLSILPETYAGKRSESCKKEDRQEFARWTYYDMVEDLTAFAKNIIQIFMSAITKDMLDISINQ